MEHMNNLFILCGHAMKANQRFSQVVFSDYFQWVSAHCFEEFNSFYLYNEPAFIILNSSVENTFNIDLSTCVMLKAG